MMSFFVSHTLFWAAALACAVAQGAIVRSVLIGSRHVADAGTAGGSMPAAAAARRPAELVWALAPALALAAVLVATWRALPAS